MKIQLTKENETVITAESLALFSAKNVKMSRLTYRSADGEYTGGDFVTSLSYRVIKNGDVYIITGEHDGIYTMPDRAVIEKIKRVKRASSSAVPWSDAAFLAEAFLTAFLVCKVKNISEVVLRVTLQGENSKKSFEFDLSLSYLSKIFDSMLTRAAPFAAAKKNFEVKGRTDIRNMPFPYSNIREGQKDFINEVYRAVKKGRRLVAAAPTGTGKTVSALFPSVKAVGEGYAEKIFYLTAKTVTGKNALDAMRRINFSAPDVRAVSIIAKERCCPAKKTKNLFPADSCAACPRLCSTADADYTERNLSALSELLSLKPICDAADIKLAAEKYYLCPYELSLDFSEYCQVIVCDYNYVFDTGVRFRRYFTDGNLKYILLVDEAHNLPDRTREMYSAHINEKLFLKLTDYIKKYMPGEGGLLACLERALEQFDKISELCRENTELYEGGSYGYFIEQSIPEGFSKPFSELSARLKKAMRWPPLLNDENGGGSEVKDLPCKIISAIYGLLRAEDCFDEHFAVFGETRDGVSSLNLLCLDPSSILDTLMRGAVCSVMFSATLTPLDYFADILGCKNAATLELESPYDPDNLCIAAVDTVSTRLSSRRGTAARIAELILSAVEAKEGNYLVYFPSYKYMKEVVREFLAVAPRNIRAVMQKPDMTLASREKFLSFFTEKGEGTLVGFCVLGGIFSEGIDLPDKELIGAVLVGVGLPGISSELNILKDYYDRTREDGFNFAYVYPGMIKILQAAGRVIRGENDRGAVVLIDERYGDPSVKRIFPSHWKNMRYVGDSRSLSKYLKDFWKNEL